MQAWSTLEFDQGAFVWTNQAGMMNKSCAPCVGTWGHTNDGDSTA